MVVPDNADNCLCHFDLWSQTDIPDKDDFVQIPLPEGPVHTLVECCNPQEPFHSGIRNLGDLGG